MSTPRQLGQISPSVRWPANSRVPSGDRAAIDAVVREAEQALRAIGVAVVNLQTATPAASPSVASSAPAAISAQDDPSAWFLAHHA